MSSNFIRCIAQVVSLALAFATGCVTEVDPGETASASVAADTMASAHPPDRPAHCVAPWGIDWNDALHVKKAAIVYPFCNEIQAGDPYIPLVFWITNAEDGVEGGPVLYPPGYTPRRKAPMDDFLHKLDKVRYVVQPGNLEFIFRGSKIKKLVTADDVFRGSIDFTPPQLAWPTAAMLGELPPLPPGSYSATAHFIMSDTHCDGQTSVFADSCLSAGDNVSLTREFVVEP